MKKVLITGGTGFVGQHLAEAILASGEEVELHLTTYSHKQEPNQQPATIHALDLTDHQATSDLIQQLQPDEIYHLASMAEVGKSFANSQQVLESNLRIQLNILEAVKDHAPQTKMLVVGSAMSYDLTGEYAEFSPKAVSELYPLGPISPYAVSKTAQDLLSYSYAHSYGLKIVRVRPFNHIGEGQSPDFAIPAFAQQIAKIEAGQQTSLQVGNLDSIRDLTDVKDMVQAYLLLMDKGESGQVYNIGTGQGYQMKDVLDMMISLSEAEISVEVDQARLRPADVPVAIADPAKIKQLGWEPRIELEQTLTRILNYWRGQL